MIKKTCEALKGAKNAIIHLYNSTSTAQREIVFGKSKKEIIELAVSGVKSIKTYKNLISAEKIILEYSPESFTGTELDYSVDICNAVIDEWQPSSADKIIINLPATVESSLPNIYADRIEWFSNKIKKRDSIIISVHTHNDRGCAVAAAELALLAGAERIEGALFGNGERSGNMDIVTMALNLFSSGINPELDFSDINHIAAICKQTTGMYIHQRHPYSGELVYTAFSGSHQDAINKGLKFQKKSCAKKWNVPYLPIDPADVGRNYEALIRINSQSGKSGAAYIMESEFGIIIPKWMQSNFGSVIQKLTEERGNELSANDIQNAFKNEYLNFKGIYSLTESHIDTIELKENINNDNQTHINAVITVNQKKLAIFGEGNGMLDAFVKGFIKSYGAIFTIENYSEHALDSGSDASAIAYIEIGRSGGNCFFAAAVDKDIGVASIKAVLNAINKF